MKEKVLAMANETAAAYLEKFDVLGIEEEKESSWFYAVGKYKNSDKMDVLSVAKKDSGCETTVFWDFYHFAIIYAIHECGYKLKWMPNGNPMWPVWYLNRFEMKNFLIEYDKMIGKYGFDRVSVEKNIYA